MSTKFLPITLIISLFSMVVNGQWTEMNNCPNKAVKKFNFIDDNLGYALTNDVQQLKNVIIKTTDGGNTWDSIPTFNQNDFMDFSFVADSVGFTVFRDMSNSSAPMRIYKTADDGQNWQDITPSWTNTGMGHSVVQFLDENIGFWGVAHVLYKTIDGGINWDTVNLNNVSVMSLDFIDANNGVIGTWDNSFFYSGSMYSTNDGGNTFNILNLNIYNTVIDAIDYMNNNTVYASCLNDWFGSGRTPFICKSTDNGISWDSIPIGTFNINQATLTAVDFKDNLNGKIVLKTPFSDTAYVYKTIDGTQSWIFEDTVYLQDVSDLHITTSTGYAAGDVNEIYKLSNSLSDLENYHDNSSILLYPNPTAKNSILNISSENNFQFAEIFDFTGRLLKSISIEDNKMKLSDFSPGIYILKLNNQNNYFTKSVIVK